jgi:TonB family protein
MGWRSRAVACLAVFVAWAATATGQKFRPRSLHSPPGDFSACRVVGSADFGSPKEVNASISLDESGKVETIKVPERSPAWLVELADCVAKRLEFDPEVRAGKVAKSQGQLQLIVERLPAGLANEFGVARIGDFITPPRFRSGTGDAVSRCIPRDAPSDRVSRFVITATVAADGNITATGLPVGAQRWMEDTAQCFAKTLNLLPGTRNGEPVEAKVSIPLVLNNDGSSGALTPARPPSDREQVESAYRACYPQDQLATGSVFFNFDVTVDGEVSRAKIVRGSGDPVLDKAAECILPRLRFEPSKHGDKAVQSNITWELPVRPPR